MKYNFDETIAREDTASVKYDLRKLMFGREDVIPMWVADMDFRTPDFIMEAINQRAQHGILGYSIRPESYYHAIESWLMRHHAWKVEPQWICFAPGIVPALNLAVLAFTKPGDRIIIQPPVYFPFFGAVKQNERVLVYNPLCKDNGRYQMDFTHLEKQCKKGAAMLILCNPHNPGGAAWTLKELERLATTCIKYNTLIVSDEIHADLVNIGFKHTVLASISPEIANNTITLTAPSKTFNIAALSTASVIISNDTLRKQYNDLLETLHLGLGNVFGTVASTAAYSNGDEWLIQLLEYINGNLIYMQQYLEANLPEVKMMKPEATYMVWLNFSAMNLTDAQLNKFLITQAGLGLNQGIQFGKEGKGFMRMNIACPRTTLQKALDNLNEAMIDFRNTLQP